ncbi:MAG: DegT/DnrJ/EryC1/StrS aminotransferase family protein [Planctomycetota bacterium]
MSTPSILLRYDDLGPDDARYVQEVLGSGRYHHGPVAGRFEQLAAETCGCSSGVALSSRAAAAGLIGTWLAGDPGTRGEAPEIIVSPYTSTTVVAPFVAAGFHVVPVDVDPTSLTLDPARVTERISERTRAIVFSHTLGSPVNLPRVAKIAAGNEIVLIEDATCSLGTQHAGRPAGAWGRLAIVGLGYESPISAGSGAVVVTDDTTLAEELRSRRLGVEATGIRGAFSGQGLSEIQAAIALARLERLEASRDRRDAIADRYVRGLLRVKGAIVPTMDEKTDMLWSDFHVRLDPTYAEEERNRVVDSMRAHDVMVETPPPAVFQGDPASRTPIAASLWQRVIRLPMHVALSDRDIDLVVQWLEVILARENLSRG